ncbi:MULTISPECIES: very short patch repair endonuclease [Paenibacillus]|uniref:Very short patch repair endonuclease n=1 Tax=Paenibacillus barengoltzii J12 TaxID=935846 RepID=A0ABY1LYG7_9BACL|nr:MULTISPECIES: very short patch repair endonuclease [Paenibacillus]MBG9796040.1 DNA mismatch repair protein Vsr [Paenibacillus dendritiformis]SMF33608.1 T/G mismatch-specific endonuclease [Paenibacillus barengoltzii J12]
MADIVSRETRSRMMGNIRSISKLENLVAQRLWSMGIRYRRNVKGMMGRPDIAIKKYKIVIFIDSCFWHSCPIHQVIPKSNTQFWLEKFRVNRVRDDEVNQYYISRGWNLKRVWEHEFREDLDKATQHIYEFIAKCKAACKEE